MRRALASSLFTILLTVGVTGPLSSEGNAGPGNALHNDTLSAYTEVVSGTIVEFEMVPVPAGSVRVGGRKRFVDSFWMATTEIRWDAYDTYRLDEKMEGLSESEVDAISLPSKPYGFGNEIPGFGQEKYPALSVTRNAARQFARWLSAKTGHTYRLPTGAEWKRACRLGHGSPAESTKDELAEFAWYEENAEGSAHPTASLASSDLGIYDQLGNAMELVAPPKGKEDRKTEAWGGSYQSPAAETHCSARRQKIPAWQESDPQLPKSQWWLSDAHFVGFRVVRAPGDS